jgi:hypothetical protein
MVMPVSRFCIVFILLTLLFSSCKKESTDIKPQYIEERKEENITHIVINTAEELASLFENKTTEMIFNGGPNSVFIENAQQSDTDYLISFTGKYIFDSYKIITQINSYFDLSSIKKTIIDIQYKQDKNCLTLNNTSSLFFFKKIDFINTTTEDHFFWSYGESAGHTENILFFYKDGIAFYYDEFRHYPDEEKERKLKYVVFFKKN